MYGTVLIGIDRIKHISCCFNSHACIQTQWWRKASTTFHSRFNIVSTSFFVEFLLLSLSLSNRAPFVQSCCLKSPHHIRAFSSRKIPRIVFEVFCVFYICWNESHWKSFDFLFDNFRLLTHYRVVCILVYDSCERNPITAIMSKCTAKFDGSIQPRYVKWHNGKCWKSIGIQFGSGRIL